jgi:3D (Asp-Asp-Asp) domain-containing protein
LRRYGRLAAAAAASFALLAAGSSAQAATGEDPIGDLIGQAVQASATAVINLTATLYHGGAPGIRALDSLGCAVSPMRTLAVDPRVIPRRTIVFIEETVGMIMPDGKIHDGLWYASDIGGAIKGAKVDLFTGSGRTSMSAFTRKGLNLGHLTAKAVGTFTGCPPRD